MDDTFEKYAINFNFDVINYLINCLKNLSASYTESLNGERDG